MSRLRSIGVLALGVLLSAGCADMTNAEAIPSHFAELDGLRLEVALDQAILPVGESGTVTIRLYNTTAQPIQLSFASTCQILPFVESDAGTVLHPSGGAWVCGAMLTNLDIPARESVTRSLRVQGIPPGGVGPYGGASLEPGRYRAYAEVNFMARTQPSPSPRQLRSPKLDFEVR